MIMIKKKLKLLHVLAMALLPRKLVRVESSILGQCPESEKKGALLV